MASKDAIAKTVTRSLTRLTHDCQVVSEHLGVDMPTIPIHPRYGIDHLRSKQLEALADWLEGVRVKLIGDSYDITPGAQTAMDEHGLTAEQVQPEGGKITKRDVDAYLEAHAEANPIVDDDSDDDSKEADELADDEFVASEDDEPSEDVSEEGEE
ncbi:hypothetical protein G4Y79_05200 [Phototrophicus methaneseepsis]|uniref:Peripheral subunit-binding (PSBD) domain-containing protein n=1 Tax=Phototrophicus methaneseepsis TaxID=2710758 RepID=A0A7S8EBA9_9CHLR|nr:hypothetical protein [Phototrophicus methaneseepsis]QPC83777.1 hypothetical protein G4Y79_05200 [Phototrophicus methaneseepsis]